MDTVLDVKTETQKVQLRVLLALIPVDPALAIDYAYTLPRITSLVDMVANYNPRIAAELPTDEMLPGLLEEAQEWLAQP
jgi:hypothetical protein